MVGLFRCSGDIVFDDVEPERGKFSDVKLKQFSETCNFLQCLRPLTREQPYFCAQIRSLGKNSKVTIGIAGPDISDEAHPGHWNNTIGYHSNGKCYSSHSCEANTDGQAFGVGDIFGVLITYFGEKMSTVIFLKNGKPVSTRYLFETDHEKFLPTLSLESGPIDLGLMWPDAVETIPSYSEKDMSHWICPPGVTYDEDEQLFLMTDRSKESLMIQSPLPLSKEIQHYEIIVHDCSDYGAGPTVAIAMCSPLKHKSTSDLANDYFKFHPDGQALKVQKGQRMGWGILYSPKAWNTDDKDEQLVLCYVTVDTQVVFTKLMMQPPGGWYPLIMLHPDAAIVQIDMETNPHIPTTPQLEQSFVMSLTAALKINDKDIKNRALDLKMFRKSEDLTVTLGEVYTNVYLPGDKAGIHTIQFQQPLTPDNSYFCMEINKIGDSSIVVIGVADSEFPLNRYPGKLEGTIGFHSRDGKLFTGGKNNGNTTGSRFSTGDIVGIEIEVFEDKMSVALFSRNGRPVGTRYHYQKDHEKFLPTVSIFAAEEDVELNIIWQNRIGMPPTFDVSTIEEWCTPEHAVIDTDTNTIFCEGGQATIQPPYSLNRNYNHFEMVVPDDMDEDNPAAAVALSTASPISPPPVSKFKADYIVFNPINAAQKLISPGDRIGWGVLYPDNRFHDDKEQMVICYLTINKSVALVRVLFQPPGGFYPVVILSTSVEKVQLDLSSIVIREHPFTPDTVRNLIEEAKDMISAEGILTYDEVNDTFTADEMDTKKNQRLQKGKRFVQEDFAEEKLLRTVPEIGENDERFCDETFLQRKLLPKRHPKLLNLVDQMMHQKPMVKKAKGRFAKKVRSVTEGDKQKSNVCLLL